METRTNAVPPSAWRLTSHAANIAQARVLAEKFDCSGFGTLWKIGHQLRDHVCDTLVSFVQHEDPLRRERSSWVWLRPNGAVVVESSDAPEGQRVYVDSCHDLLLAVFPCRRLATPDSRYFKRVADRRGIFYGSVETRWRGFPPVWQHYLPANRKSETGYELLSGRRVTYRRFRLEPLPTDGVVARLQSDLFRMRQRDHILAWLVDGAVQPLLAAQEFPSLRQVLRANDKSLIAAAGGVERLTRMLQEKAERHLRDRLDEARPQ